MECARAPYQVGAGIARLLSIGIPRKVFTAEITCIMSTADGAQRQEYATEFRDTLHDRPSSVVSMCCSPLRKYVEQCVSDSGG